MQRFKKKVELLVHELKSVNGVTVIMPAGTFYVSNYELVIFQAGYAFTDATQLSLTVIPAPSESLSILDASLKTSLYRGGLVRAAAIGSVSGAAGKDVGLQLLGRAGGVVQVCTARRCDSVCPRS